MKKVRNSAVCAVLCLTLMLGSAFSSMAYSAKGSASYSGGKATWNVYYEDASMSATYNKNAKIHLKGTVVEENISKGDRLARHIDVTKQNVKKVSGSMQANYNNTFIRHQSNYVKVWVNNKLVLNKSF